MSEARGSSVQKALPLAVPPAGNGAGASFAPLHDEAPTQIKSGVATAPAEVFDPAQHLLGETLDHFELLDCIGVGGMGRVFRGRDKRLDRLVALKVLSPELAKEPEICRRFEQEAKAAARLDDPHFARVYFFGHSKGVYYIAMEYIEGEDVRRKIARQGRLEVAVAVNIGLQIARGLAHAAKAGVVHRDIKPSNIIVSPSGVAKLVDMGLARNLLQNSPASEITQAGVTLGTFDYIAPEQARDPRLADGRSDIYSLGCTLYHALTGRPPFPDGSALQKLLKHQTDAAPDPRRVVPELPDVLVAVLIKMMAKNPTERYASADQLVADLQAVSQMLNLELPSELRYPAVWTHLPSFWERQLTWAGPTIVLVLAVFAYHLLTRNDDFATLNVPPVLANAASLRTSPTAEATGKNRAPTESQRGESQRASSRNSDSASSDRNPAVNSERYKKVAADADLRAEIRAAEPGQVLELLGTSYQIPLKEDETGRTLGILIDKDLTLRGAARPLTEIHVDDSNLLESPSRLESALFSVVGKKLTLEHLDVRVRCSTTAADDLTAVLLDGGQVQLTNCTVSLDGGSDRNPCAVVETADDASRLTSSSITAESCYFAGGQDCIRLLGGAPVQVSFKQCAFAEFRRPLRQERSGRLNVQCDHVSLFVGPGPVFQFPATDNVRITVTDSVFSRLRGASPQPLIQLRNEFDFPNAAREAWWHGERNLYHGFEAGLLRVGTSAVVAALAELSRTWGMDEQQSKLLAQGEKWPWFASDPKMDTMPELLSNPVKAFRLSVNSEMGTASADGRPIGVRMGPWGDIYEEAAPSIASSAKKEGSRAEKNRLSGSTFGKVPGPVALRVIPDIPAGQQPQGVFRELNNALGEAPPGGVILLQTNKAIEIRDVKIANRVTLRPAENFTPRLVLKLGPSAEPPRMFQLVTNGWLKIEKIPLLIDATGSEAPAEAALFDCAEGTAVELQDLWVDIGRGMRGGNLTLAKARAPIGRATMGGMPMGMADSVPPRLTLTRCDVRSRGNVVFSDPHASWACSVTDSFLVTEEPFARVDGPCTAPAGGQINRLEITRSSFVLRDSLVAVTLDEDQPKPEIPSPIEITAERSVFLGAPAAAGSAPLARVSGNFAEGLQQETIHWQGGDNFLAGFADYFQFGGDERGGMNLKRFAADEWLSHFRLERDRYSFGQNTLPELRASSLWELAPPDAAALRTFGYSVQRADPVGADPSLLPRRPRANSAP